MATAKRKNKTSYPRTVEAELLKSWQKSKRMGDPEELAKYCGVSRPLIDRALIYGHVKKPALAEKITEFFAARKEGQLNGAKELASQLATE